MWRAKKLSFEQRDGEGPTPGAPARGRRARAADKDNNGEKWQLQKQKKERRNTREISSVDLHEEEENHGESCQSVCLDAGIIIPF